jgi:predicted membrane chloride channel (bestrophin family)
VKSRRHWGKRPNEKKSILREIVTQIPVGIGKNTEQKSSILREIVTRIPVGIGKKDRTKKNRFCGEM